MRSIVARNICCVRKIDESVDTQKACVGRSLNIRFEDSIRLGVSLQGSGRVTMKLQLVF